MGLIATLSTGLGLSRVVAPALGGVSRDIARSIAPDLARGLAEAMDRLPLPTTSALPPASPGSGYDRLIDSVNRLPRPLMAFGTQALVIYAMIDPAGFATRMAGLDAMPEALWWILGAVITAYFGAREAHHLRNRPAPAPSTVVVKPAESGPEAGLSGANPALDDWRSQG